MAININRAFDDFLTNKVNLSAEDSQAARADRDSLRSRIRKLSDTTFYFPELYEEADIDYGSFARKTKKRPLDDIDMFFCMTGKGANYEEKHDGNIKIIVNETSTNLYQYTNNDNSTLNSIKILNKFRSSLENIYAYRNSEVNRRQEVVVLQLLNKDWSFDVAPCFKTTTVNGYDFYLIPNGDGDWKKADPRIDQKRTSRINQKHNGLILNIIRIMKYWNNRATMPTMNSYLLENILLNYYDTSWTCSSYIDLELPNAFLAIQNAVYTTVPDPKGLQGNLNNLSDDEKSKIFIRAYLDHGKCVTARELEQTKPTHKECIEKWREIFGDAFPEYG